jgi:hypothetical protein
MGYWPEMYTNTCRKQISEKSGLLLSSGLAVQAYQQQTPRTPIVLTGWIPASKALSGAELMSMTIFA